MWKEVFHKAIYKVSASLLIILIPMTIVFTNLPSEGETSLIWRMIDTYDFLGLVFSINISLAIEMFGVRGDVKMKVVRDILLGMTVIVAVFGVTLMSLYNRSDPQYYFDVHLLELARVYDFLVVALMLLDYLEICIDQTLMEIQVSNENG